MAKGRGLANNSNSHQAAWADVLASRTYRSNTGHCEKLKGAMYEVASISRISKRSLHSEQGCVLP
jgi:hypothetical protein